MNGLRVLALVAPGRASIEALTYPLDRLRRSLLAVAMTRPSLAFLLARRHRRIAARLSLVMLFGLLTTVLAPALTLSLSPVLLGVPHVASDVRYFVLRQGLGRGPLLAIGAGCLSLAGLRFGGEMGQDKPLWLGLEVAAGALFAVAAALLGARGQRSKGRLLLALPVLLVAGAVGVAHAGYARVVFAHLHNLLAVLVWVTLFRKQPGLPIALLGAIGLALLLLVTGVTLRVTAEVGGMSALGLDLAEVARWLMPGAALAVALPFTLTHLFLDTVHYGIWLGAIPEEEIEAEGTLSFGMSARSLARDFGLPGLGLVGLLMAVVLVCAAFSLARTRSLYFALAGFHGYLELAMATYLLVRGGGRATPSPLEAKAQVSPGADGPRFSGRSC